MVDLQLTLTAADESALIAAQSAVPSPTSVIGLVDTGAYATIIRQGLAAKLGLQPVGVATIDTPTSSNISCLEYAVRLVFPNGIVCELAVLEAPLQGQHIDCLVGRDVLAKTVMVYIGPANLYSISF
jgi:hypothetical protein